MAMRTRLSLSSKPVPILRPKCLGELTLHRRREVPGTPRSHS